MADKKWYENVSVDLSDPKDVANVMADFVNLSSRPDMDDFAFAMKGKHRTLQQAFTQLCLCWLDTMATNTNIDGRNEYARDAAIKCMDVLGGAGKGYWKLPCI